MAMTAINQQRLPLINKHPGQEAACGDHGMANIARHDQSLVIGFHQAAAHRSAFRLSPGYPEGLIRGLAAYARPGLL